jgi:predicted NAD/FAD-binding protein
MRIAVIGSGISGCLAARLLATEHDVWLYERQASAGGHSHTLEVPLQGRHYAVDTGFMVFNERTYPNFCRMLQLLQMDSQPSDMSFSVRCGRTGLEYQGSSLNGLFSQRRNLWRPGFYRLLADILRFNRSAIRTLAEGTLDDQTTVGDFLARSGVGPAFVDQYFVPMTASIWSTRPSRIHSFPARFMIGFCHNHGLLQLRGRPQWRTLVGGARNYVRQLTDPLGERLRLGQPVTGLWRQTEGVQLRLADGTEHRVDQAVIAAHADDALAMLRDATDQERDILAAFPYQVNHAVLHTDSAQLPRQGRARASWNYQIPADPEHAVSVTYDLSRLQRHDSPQSILLTLNPSAPIDPPQRIVTMQYEHPAYCEASVTAQRRWGQISGRWRVHFCGAYWGYGFHEDGVNSALAVADRLLSRDDRPPGGADAPAAAAEAGGQGRLLDRLRWPVQGATAGQRRDP